MAGQDPRKPGDEVAPQTPQSGQNICPRCGGSGLVAEEPCAECNGTGTITTLVGDA